MDYLLNLLLLVWFICNTCVAAVHAVVLAYTSNSDSKLKLRYLSRVAPFFSLPSAVLFLVVVLDQQFSFLAASKFLREFLYNLATDLLLFLLLFLVKELSLSVWRADSRKFMRRVFSVSLAVFCFTALFLNVSGSVAEGFLGKKANLVIDSAESCFIGASFLFAGVLTIKAYYDFLAYVNHPFNAPSTPEETKEKKAGMGRVKLEIVLLCSLCALVAGKSFIVVVHNVTAGRVSENFVYSSWLTALNLITEAMLLSVILFLVWPKVYIP